MTDVMKRGVYVRKFTTAVLAIATCLALHTPASAYPLDAYGRPTEQILNEATNFANNPLLPTDLRNLIHSAVTFYQTDTSALPENAPNISQFIWPTVSTNCIGEGLNSVGSGIAVPGPTTIPAPGAATGETTFLFTALGTNAVDRSNINVHWVNIRTLQHGFTPLGNNGINPEGPSTVSGTAATGAGTVIAVMSGGLRPIDQANHCSFLPTIAIFEVQP